MKVNGKMIKDKAKESKFGQMAMFIKDNFNKTIKVEKEFINGKMAEFMKDNGNLDCNQVKEYINGLMEIYMKVNLKMA